MDTKATAPKSADKQRSPIRQTDHHSLQHPTVEIIPVAPEPTRLFTPALRKPQDVLAMQRMIGNTATLKLIQRDGGGAGAPAPADPAPAALTQLRAGTLIERNTAQMIDTGRLHYYYIDQCAPDPSSTLDAASPYKDVLHPSTNAVMRIQKNAQGFRDGDYVFIARNVPIDRVKSIFVHEVNHAMRGDHESDEHADSLARYKDEFQAYWVAEFAGVADLDARAVQIRTHILSSYPALQTRYNSEAPFKAQIDAHTRPDGNVTNSVRWQNAEQAAEASNRTSFYAWVRVMNSAEKQLVRANAEFMGKVRAGFSGDDLLVAYLLLFDFSEHAVNCVDAMRGAGTDEEKIYSNLLDATPAERARLKAYGSFMARLRDDLNGEEMGVVNRILNT